MSDVRDLLTSTTPTTEALPDVDLDAVARRGARRRTGKRLGAAVLSLALVAGGVQLVAGLGTDDVPVVDERPGEADAGDGTWSSLPAPDLTPRAHPFVATTSGGQVVVVGGAREGGRGQTETGATITGTEWLLDGAVLSAGEWRALPTAPVVAAPTWGVADDWLYMLSYARPGAVTGDGTVIDSGASETWSLHRLDLRDPQGWEAVPAPPTADAARAHEVTLLGDTVVAMPIWEGVRDAADAHVLRDGTWTAVTGPAPQVDASAVVTGNGDQLALVGDVDSGPATASILDLGTASWRSADVPPFVGDLGRSGAVERDGRVLVVTSPEGSLPEAAWLDLADGTWTPALLPDVGPDAVVRPGPPTRFDQVVPLVPDDELVLASYDLGTRTTTSGGQTQVTAGTATQGVVALHRLDRAGDWQLVTDAMPEVRAVLGIQGGTDVPHVVVRDDRTVGLVAPEVVVELAGGQMLRATSLALARDGRWVREDLPTLAAGTRVLATGDGVLAVGGRPVTVNDDWDPSAPLPTPEFEVNEETGLRYQVPIDPLVERGWAFDDDGEFPADVRR